MGKYIKNSINFFFYFWKLAQLLYISSVILSTLKTWHAKSWWSCNTSHSLLFFGLAAHSHNSTIACVYYMCEWKFMFSKEQRVFTYRDGVIFQLYSCSAGGKCTAKKQGSKALGLVSKVRFKFIVLSFAVEMWKYIVLSSSLLLVLNLIGGQLLWGRFTGTKIIINKLYPSTKFARHLCFSVFKVPDTTATKHFHN